MDSVQLLNLALAMVGALMSILMATIGWIGSKIYNKLDSLSEKIDGLEREVHDKILVLDRRVTRLEAKLGDD